MLFLLALFVPLLTVLLTNSVYGNVPESIPAALFQAVSALTTTGFQTVDSFASWTPAMMFLMILLMLIGGGAGSTAGGLEDLPCLCYAEGNLVEAGAGYVSGPGGIYRAD